MNKQFEPRFRAPRVWSNTELNNIAHLFKGDIVNVSAWQDEDKQGNYYKSYFKNAKSYSLTNYKAEARGFQGKDGEIFLNLEEDLPEDLKGKWDVVFNHTTLEHVFEFRKAFQNLCTLSRDVVIIIVPFLQEMHGHYGDYWRFTPIAIQKLFQENGYNLHYSSFNTDKNESVYLFCVGLKPGSVYEKKIENEVKTGLDPSNREMGIIGFNALNKTKKQKKKFSLKKLLKSLLGR